MSDSNLENQKMIESELEFKSRRFDERLLAIAKGHRKRLNWLIITGSLMGMIGFLLLAFSYEWSGGLVQVAPLCILIGALILIIHGVSDKLTTRMDAFIKLLERRNSFDSDSPSNK